MRVAVISGGRSSEHEVSLQSGASVAAGLREAGHEVLEVLIERDGRWLAEGAEVPMRAAGGLLGCDVAFPVLHGPFGEDGTVQGLLECLDVAYVGPSVLSAAVAMDKLVCKRLLAYDSLPQVEFAEVGAEGWRERVEAMARPLWVKPSRLGSSVGISRVADPATELDAAVEAALAHDPRVIVEADAGGREVECSVIGNAGIGDDASVETSVPGAIVTRASDWYDFEAKYAEGGMELVVPAPLEPEVDRPRPRAGRPRLRRDRRHRARALRLLRPPRRRGARQRDQHDPRLHRDQRLRQALRGDRRPVPRALRPAGRARGRAPPARALVPVLGARRRRSAPPTRSRPGTRRRRRRAR